MRQPFDPKYVGFVGTFSKGKKLLKRLVYEAGGIPVDYMPCFTDYIVVEAGGEKTAAYMKHKSYIDKDMVSVLTEQELIVIV
ncbi:hypothetical protein AGMMS49992_08850 [Clostridia bacterium]|nr:hypothetical protein AGMMS49992_08850 [Clostridia bacterium]